MFPTSAKHTDQFEYDGVTYLISTPTLLTRASFRRAVSTMGAVYHSDEILLNAVRDGIRECVADDQQGELLATIDSFELERDNMVARGDDSSDQDKAEFEGLAGQLTQIEAFMTREYPRYSEMVADRMYWLSIAPIVAFKQFVSGWDNGAAEFKRRAGQVDDEVMEALPTDHIETVGWHAIGLMSPNKAQEKNSEPQLQSQADLETTTADATPPTVEPDGT